MILAAHIVLFIAVILVIAWCLDIGQRPKN